jgi:hypothetical protein
MNSVAPVDRLLYPLRRSFVAYKRGPSGYFLNFIHWLSRVVLLAEGSGLLFDMPWGRDDVFLRLGHFQNSS